MTQGPTYSPTFPHFRFFGDYACSCEFNTTSNLAGSCSYRNECGSNLLDATSAPGDNTATCGANSLCSDPGLGYNCQCIQGYSYPNGNVRRSPGDVNPITNAETGSCQPLPIFITTSNTGIEVLVNTSFNRAGEPIVRSPAEALRCARAAGLDLLVIDRHLIHPPPG